MTAVRSPRGTTATAARARDARPKRPRRRCVERPSSPPSADIRCHPCRCRSCRSRRSRLAVVGSGAEFASADATAGRGCRGWALRRRVGLGVDWQQAIVVASTAFATLRQSPMRLAGDPHPSSIKAPAAINSFNGTDDQRRRSADCSRPLMMPTYVALRWKLFCAVNAHASDDRPAHRRADPSVRIDVGDVVRSLRSTSPSPLSEEWPSTARRSTP